MSVVALIMVAAFAAWRVVRWRGLNRSVNRLLASDMACEMRQVVGVRQGSYYVAVTETVVMFESKIIARWMAPFGWVHP